MTSWPRWRRRPPADARNAGAIGRHFESLFTNGIGMDQLKEGPDFLGVKLKYWAPLMTQYQQAKRDGQLTADSQAIPLIVRSGTSLDLKYSVKIEEIDASGNVTKDVGTVTRSLDKDYLPVRLQVPVRPGLARFQGPVTAAGRHRQLQPGPLQPRRPGAPTSPPRPSTRTAPPPRNGAVGQVAPRPGDWVTVNRLPEKAANGAPVDQTQRNPVDERSYRREPRDRQEARHPARHGLRHLRPRAGQGSRRRRQPAAPRRLRPDAVHPDQGRVRQEVPHTELKPSLSATGLASQSAGAITDYYGLAAARGYDENANVIDAVRVRAKAPGSWKQAQPEVEKLANEIRDMGLQATVVAGSAREDANISVPGYSKDDAGKESPLGTVQQSWVRQDAADAVSGSLTATNLTLLFLTLCGAALLTGASTVSYVRKRRSEAGTLRAMGWTQRRIRSWVLAEFGVGAALLAVVGHRPEPDHLERRPPRSSRRRSWCSTPVPRSSRRSSCATARKSTRNRSTTNGSSRSIRR